ncbi:hypothetical protein AMECASPLE_008413 [Ameca splendens]|uniref:Uncharacterized protein n=1 Tax=Ameca splendens TaxID=208324 RepID=A0ABV1A696_9TELE
MDGFLFVRLLHEIPNKYIQVCGCKLKKCRNLQECENVWKLMYREETREQTQNSLVGTHIYPVAWEWLRILPEESEIVPNTFTISTQINLAEIRTINLKLYFERFFGPLTETRVRMLICPLMT